MTPQPNSYLDLFEAFDAAREAYLRLEDRGPEMTDQQLARDGDYKDLFMAGRRLEGLGGRAAIDGAIVAFFPRDCRRASAARHNLDHWWAGFGIWRETPAARRAAML